MPQHELWAASARPTGLRIEYTTPDARLQDDGLLVVAPLYSKAPRGRTGYVSIEVPTFMSQDLPTILEGAMAAWLWARPCDVSTVVQASVRTLLQEYQEGARS